MTGLILATLVPAAVFLVAGTAAGLRSLRAGEPRALNAARLLGLAAAADLAVYLALAGIRTGRFPIDGAFGAFVFMAMFVVLLALAMDWLRRMPILVVAALPLAAATTVLALALLLAPEPAAEPPRPGGLWTGIHVLVALGSYGAFAMAFVSGIVYLVEQRRLKEHALTPALGLMPSLETVARINVRAIAAGVALLAAGLVVGYLQARSLYAGLSGWRLDPKITLTTATLLVYAALLALSARPSFKGRRTALASVLSFGLVLLTFWASVFGSGFHNFR